MQWKDEKNADVNSGYTESADHARNLHVDQCHQMTSVPAMQLCVEYPPCEPGIAIPHETRERSEE